MDHLRCAIWTACALLAAQVAYGFDHSPISFHVEGSRIIANGEVDGDALDAFEDALEDHPDVTTLVLEYVPGSVDDVANLELARAVRALGLDTALPAGGLVASGGTDLFLAGRVRRLEEGACVGVHAWAGGDVAAEALPKGDPEHDRNLDYYEEMDVDEAFYWFTLSAAPAEDMYWMRASDISRFGLIEGAVPDLAPHAVCTQR